MTSQTDAELLALYRDIFAEITAKAIPVCDPESDNPERVRYYRLPVGPLHRAAGKVGFQMFDGEAHLAAAIARIRELEGSGPKPLPSRARIELDAKSVGFSLAADEETLREIREIEQNAASAAANPQRIVFD